MYKRQIAILVAMLAVVGIVPTPACAETKTASVAARSRESVHDAEEKIKEALHAVMEDEMDDEHRHHHHHHRHISKD